MDRREAIQKIEAIIDNGQDYGYWTDAQRKALDLAIEALEREIEYGQMVVDLTKGEKVDDWVYDEDESAATTDCISRADTIKAICAECVWKHGCRGECTEVKVAKGMPSVSGEEVDYCNNCPYISYNNEDCISRQQAVEAVTNTIREKFSLADWYEQLVETGLEIENLIKELPPVTPTERTGEWVNSKGEPVDDSYSVYCSRCKAWSEYRDIYCGNCGAKMGGVDNE